MLKSFHNRFRHVEPYMGFLLSAGFFSWVSKEAAVFGVDTWSEAVLLGSAFGFVAMFALAALLIGWRYFTPLPTSTPASTDLPLLDADETLRTPNDVALRAEIVRVEKKLDTLAMLLNDSIKTQSEAVSDFGKSLHTLQKGTRDLPSLERVAAEIGALIGPAEQETKRNINTLFLALQGIRARQKLDFYERVIDEEVPALRGRFDMRQPIKGDDWLEWEKHHHRFESALTHWLKVANGWHPKLGDWVEGFDRSLLVGARWVGIDEIFANSNHSTIFKTFLLKLENWIRLKGHADAAVHIASFTGPHALANLEGIEGGPPTLERVERALND